MIVLSLSVADCAQFSYVYSLILCFSLRKIKVKLKF